MIVRVAVGVICVNTFWIHAVTLFVCFYLADDILAFVVRIKLKRCR